MKPITQIKFWQLPVALRLVVIWFFVLGLNSFWKTISTYTETRYDLNIGSLIAGIVYLVLASGLVNRSNASRMWAILFASLGSLVGLFVLGVAVFEDPYSTNGFHLQAPMPQAQKIIFTVAFLILNVGTLYILLRPKTKVFFAPQTNQYDKQ